MKQFVQVALVCGVLAAATADKRPFQRGQGFAPFAFQRQTEGTEDLSPPAPGAPGPAAPGGAPAPGNYNPGGDDAGGPYPPSGQPESGPYPPSGWKPQGQRLELPARQQKPPQNSYGAPPKQPQQQYGAPPKQPQQQYGAPPKQPQQQYGAPQAPAEPESPSAPAAEPATESPDVVASNRLRNQLRQQRVILQRMRQVVRDQQAQLQQQRQEQQALLEQLQQLRQQNGEQAAQGQYVVNLPDGRVQRVQYANTPSSTSVFKQNVQQTEAAQAEAAAGRNAQGFPSDPPTYVARLQFMDVPPIEAPVFSYSGSAPLVQVA
ncbi:mediator of RNA polymerase II transcription subunit 15-like isoform X2 [Thrips palmi]|uniref:Mediator of RNA polymerase II transcription subunit 15-like isoform X2 n=1 Tax=Thrips palmi TaxID=161013 RepID=A0A6P9A4G7_THRPL|nr:mediator of RNA polymerase II transcription subunit 15-like isoform X2 [Thrips palmi]